MQLSLDELLAALQAVKDSGVPGTTPVAIPAPDNNGRGGYRQRVEAVVVDSVAKADVDKGFGLCKAVSRGGVPFVVIR